MTFDLSGPSLRRYGSYATLGTFFLWPLSLGAASVLLLLAVLLTAGGAFRLGQRPDEQAWKQFGWLYFLIGGAAVFVSPDIGFSQYNYIHLIGRYALGFGLMLYHGREPDFVPQSIGALFAAAVAVSLIGIWQHFSGVANELIWVDPERFPHLKNRVFATLENPNLLAGYLCMTISLSAAGALYWEKTSVRLWSATAAGIGILCLVYTYSRGAWVSMFVVLSVLLLGKGKRYLLLFIAALGPVLFLYRTSVIARLMSIFEASDTSSSLRLALWESTMAMIQDYPVLGVGWGAYHLMYPTYDFFIQNPEVVIYHAHNMWLNLAAETGLLGVAAFGAAFVTAIRQAKRLTGQNDSWNRILGIGSIAAWATVFLNGLTDYVLFNIQLSALFWMWAGLLQAKSWRRP